MTSLEPAATAASAESSRTELALSRRVRQWRNWAPPLLVLLVVIYQLGVAQTLERLYGHGVHYAVEVAFYSLTGPVVLWLILSWVEHNLREKESLAQEIRAVRQEQTAILAEERARIARDLHDGVAQTLYFLALQADLCREQLKTVGQPPDAVITALGDMGHKLRQVISDVRRTIFALQPLAWPAGQFWASLADFVHRFAEQTGWQVELQFVNGEVLLPARLELVVFRLVQESLNNVAKHATASRVSVSASLSRDGQSLSVTVSDDGIGFDAASVKPGGLGLGQMRGRLQPFGGHLEVESTPGQGTRIWATVPLPVRTQSRSIA